MDRRTLLFLLLLACDGPFHGGQEGEDISGDDGGTTTGDGGAGTTDGGSAADGGTTEPDEGAAQVGRSGQVTVAKDALSGTETTQAVGLYGEVDCAVTYAVTSTGPLDSCDACAWAFDVVISEPALTSDVGCDLVGMDAAAFDGHGFAYGYTDSYLGGDAAFMYGYGDSWYAVGGVTVDGDSYSYTWDDTLLWTY